MNIIIKQGANKMSFKHIKMAAGMLALTALFTGCSNPVNDVTLPPDGSNARKQINEICLKALPPEESKALKDAINHNSFTDFARRDELLRRCLKNLSEGKVPVPQ
jgi:hypothetical protein